MSATTGIEWCDATWNPGFAVRTPSGPRWTGRVELTPSMLQIPLRRRKPTTYFVNSMSDLFHEALPDEAIDRVFAVMALCPQHKFLVLTKRAERMREWVSTMEWAAGTPLPNVGLGVSVEDQATADQRIPLLFQTPAAMRFMSYEPALGPVHFTGLDYRILLRTTLVDFARWDAGKSGEDPDTAAKDAAATIPSGDLGDSTPAMNALTGEWFDGWDSGTDGPKLDWLISGGESGPGARPAHPDWFRSVRDQCAAAGVPFFFKQWGHFRPIGCADMDSEDFDHAAVLTANEEATVRVWPDGTKDDGSDYSGRRGGWFMEPVGKRAAGRLLDGRIHDARPGGW